ncbi:MAG: hypothetical protein AB7E61_02970 [Acholeplasmataceae bacterium]
METDMLFKIHNEDNLASIKILVKFYYRKTMIILYVLWIILVGFIIATLITLDEQLIQSTLMYLLFNILLVLVIFINKHRSLKYFMRLRSEAFAEFYEDRIVITTDRQALTYFVNEFDFVEIHEQFVYVSAHKIQKTVISFTQNKELIVDYFNKYAKDKITKNKIKN